MLLDSLCAYLVFSCFIIILVLLSPSPVCVFVCFLFFFAKFYLCALSVLLQFFFLNICLCFAVHLTFRLSLACCSLFINSITNFRFRSSTICVFPPQLASTVLSFFFPYLLSLICAPFFHWTKWEQEIKAKKSKKQLFLCAIIGGKIRCGKSTFSVPRGVLGKREVGKQINQKLKVQQKAGKARGKVLK